MRVRDATKQMIHMRGPNNHPAIAWTWRFLVVIAADFIGAVAVNNFLTPAHILAGGVTGVAQLIHHYVRFIGLGTMFFIFNIPLFLLGYRFLGKRFIFLTGLAILGFSVFTDAVHLHFQTASDPLLKGLYGGVLSGVSSAIVIRIGGSMGGTDILSLVIHRLTGRSVGSTGLIMNVIVLFLSMFVFGVPAAMYTLISMFASSRVVNALMHFQQRKTALIVTACPEEVAKAIGDRLTRGSTIMRASGAYTHAERGVLLCAMTHLEIADLKEIVLATDEHAFMTVLDTTEVVGRFRELKL
ncbi:YitT family protein [Alicyclobacillus fastidiosus]|uniref:YitT family protein n=1 Tax=Alicyclobacillus fastidiosus TaxID=392011 RepID=A0ABV5AC21_9BACL|nr:YitT family protein [Alicyclobacillus fastidiosus]WEH10430.1 YitT family protein [Alicyclobacillus fastidiosus]